MWKGQYILNLHLICKYSPKYGWETEVQTYPKTNFLIGQSAVKVIKPKLKEQCLYTVLSTITTASIVNYTNMVTFLKPWMH